MPRPRVKDEDRKRVARACDTCKRRKEKCDGDQPCLLCKRRSREAECHYSDGHQRGGRKASSTPQRPARDGTDADRTTIKDNAAGGRSSSPQPHRSTSRLDDTLANVAVPPESSNDAEIAIESLLTLSGNRSVPKKTAHPSSSGHRIPHAPVPKLARLLRDGHGKFIFVGDSSTLAFLQNIRRLAKLAIGECSLTTDPKRHAMVEAIPVEKSPGHSSSSASTSRSQAHFDPKPTKQEAEELVASYLLASSGIIDLFGQRDIMQHLLAWVTEKTQSSGNNSTSAIFYLVLAIGAQNLSAANEEQAAFYFRKGRELAVSSFMDDPSVLTVQSYVLIAFYMLTTCRRNGAFMLLGIAIRAAYALGLHRSDISVLFEARERRTRERVWKSLRVLDMFMSASLGRPPATSEVDGGNVAWEGTSRGYEDIRLQALHSSAMLRICFIFERVLNEVYCRREVSVQLVESISRQYRDWNLGLDAGLQRDGLTEGDENDTPELQQMTGLAHIKGSYYWSIILLTRPFLIFDVSTKLKAASDEISQKASETTTLSEACIDAALRSIEIGSDLVHTPGCSRRPFMVTNSVFVSALVMGLAMFGDYDKTFPLLSSLDQAKVVLGALAKYDPAGRRFVLITTFLQQAALEHIRRRDEKQLQKRRLEIHSIFGDILNRDSANGDASSSGFAADLNNGERAGTTLNFGPPDENEPSWAGRIEDDATTRRGPVLTTSGALAPSSRDPQVDATEDSAQGFNFTVFTDLESPMTGDIPSIPSYNEEFPLFSLMDEYDAANDLFLDFI